jgi:hypothetical protein
VEPFERDDYPFPGQCVAIINPKSEVKAKRCGKVAAVFVANLFPVCGLHREYLQEETCTAASVGTIHAQAALIDELEDEIRRVKGSADEWRRLANAKHGNLAGEFYMPTVARDSFVYFIQGGDYIKIGKAVDPVSRLAQLRLGGVIVPDGIKLSDIKMVGIERGGRDRESALHRQFSQSRVVGEWFHADPRLVDYIRGLPELLSPQWGELVLFEPVLRGPEASLYCTDLT